jgi:hypothetical protein
LGQGETLAGVKGTRERIQEVGNYGEALAAGITISHI